MPTRRQLLIAGVATGVTGWTAVRCLGARSLPEKTPLEWGQDRFFGAAQPFAAVVAIDPQAVLHRANPALCGTNVQWVDGGDGLLQDGSLDFSAPVLKSIQQLSPSVIRYPGGSNSDLYDWRAGIGNLAGRGISEHFHRKEKQIVRFGTDEFMQLCQVVGAQGLITVNASTRSAADAADWVAYINVDRVRSAAGERLPKVQLWEVGNEPYLKESVRPETWVSPSDYAQRANGFIVAMRAADPEIRIGIPLRSDRFSTGLEATPYQGYNDVVLAGVTEHYDYVSVHDAYLPLAIDREPSDQELYASLMASVECVRDDFAATRKQLAKYPLRAQLPIALTEYNALVSIGTSLDAYLASPAAAIYVADLLCFLASRTDVLTADYWSLIGNWYFGAIGPGGNLRPAFAILRMFRELLQGDLIKIEVRAQREFSAPALGIARSRSGLPALTGVASRQGATTRILLVNKSPNGEANVTLETGSSASRQWVLRSWAAMRAFANPDATQPYALTEAQLGAKTGPLMLSMPPSSVLLLEGREG